MTTPTQRKPEEIIARLESFFEAGEPKDTIALITDFMRAYGRGERLDEHDHCCDYCATVDDSVEFPRCQRYRELEADDD